MINFDSHRETQSGLLIPGYVAEQLEADRTATSREAWSRKTFVELCSVVSSKDCPLDERWNAMTVLSERSRSLEEDRTLLKVLCRDPDSDIGTDSFVAGYLAAGALRGTQHRAILNDLTKFAVTGPVKAGRVARLVFALFSPGLASTENIDFSAKMLRGVIVSNGVDDVTKSLALRALTGNPSRFAAAAFEDAMNSSGQFNPLFMQNVIETLATYRPVGDGLEAVLRVRASELTRHAIMDGNSGIRNPYREALTPKHSVGSEKQAFVEGLKFFKGIAVVQAEEKLPLKEKQTPIPPNISSAAGMLTDPNPAIRFVARRILQDSTFACPDHAVAIEAMKAIFSIFNNVGQGNKNSKIELPLKKSREMRSDDEETAVCALIALSKWMDPARINRKDRAGLTRIVSGISQVDFGNLGLQASAYRLLELAPFGVPESCNDFLVRDVNAPMHEVRVSAMRVLALPGAALTPNQAQTLENQLAAIIKGDSYSERLLAIQLLAKYSHLENATSTVVGSALNGTDEDRCRAVLEGLTARMEKLSPNLEARLRELDRGAFAGEGIAAAARRALLLSGTASIDEFPQAAALDLLRFSFPHGDQEVRLRCAMLLEESRQSNVQIIGAVCGILSLETANDADHIDTDACASLLGYLKSRDYTENHKDLDMVLVTLQTLATRFQQGLLREVCGSIAQEIAKATK